MSNPIISLYAPSYPVALIYILQGSDYKSLKYLKAFWRTPNFSNVETSKLERNAKNKKLINLLVILTCLIVFAGLALITLSIWDNIAGVWEFGIAIIIGYPVIIAHLLPLINFLIGLPSLPKRAGRAIVCNILENQVIQLRERHDFKIIAVAGSVGKTSTKLAIAKVLSASYKVIFQEGNYNDRVTVPLIFFDEPEPNIFNIFAWTRIFLSNWSKLLRKYPYEVVVVEIGTDGPGFLQDFEYLQPDIFVLTAIAEEHMEYFKTLDAVANEELTPLGFSKTTIINLDNTPAKYLPSKKYISYGVRGESDYMVTKRQPNGLKDQKLSFKLPGNKAFTAETTFLGEQGAEIVLSAVAVAGKLGLKPEEIAEGLKNLSPVSGRMQILAGKEDSSIIDDTYNASPTAVKAALDVLYQAKASQRIAILGNMNELGEYSPEAHIEIGNYCDPKKLDLIVTIGPDANIYLAAAAKQVGCKVKSFDSPYEAGKYVKGKLKQHAVVLAKGSQNGVFAEESVKLLLENPDDAAKLVRQSPYWMNIKQRQFPSE